MNRQGKFLILAALAAAAALASPCFAAEIAETGQVLVLDAAPTHSVKVVMPPNAPSIASDYRSAFNEAGLRRRPPMPEHTGIDIKLPIGRPVLAATDGRVFTASFERFGGNSIRIGHGELMTIYLHLSRIDVAAGDVVRRGQVIGASGNTTGEFANMTPHLHFGVIRFKGTDPGPVEIPKGEEMLRNPHLFWYDGEGQIVCYDENRSYSDAKDKFIYPVHCVGDGQG